MCWSALQMGVWRMRRRCCCFATGLGNCIEQSTMQVCSYINLCCTVQVIIFLYLLEEETSYVVLFSSGLGLIIEFWKLTQAMSISLDWSAGYPKLKFADQKSYS